MDLQKELTCLIIEMAKQLNISEATVYKTLKTKETPDSYPINTITQYQNNKTKLDDKYPSLQGPLDE